MQAADADTAQLETGEAFGGFHSRTADPTLLQSDAKIRVSSAGLYSWACSDWRGTGVAFASSDRSSE